MGAWPWLRAAGFTGALATVVLGCAPDFDTTRAIPQRGTLGQELYSLVCDRVGAQALRMDVTGASFHAVCHPDAKGKYAERVDRYYLPPLRADARDVQGKLVSLEKQQRDRDYQVARVEALGRRREDLVAAFDAILPDIDVLLRRPTPEDPETGCDEAAFAKQKQAYLELMADTLSRFVDLYNDGTIPGLTRALGGLMHDVRDDEGAAAALARIDARQGYRPLQVALGVSRPALSYPRLYDLANSLLRLFAADSDPNNPAHKLDPSAASIVDNHTPVPGKAHEQFQSLLRVVREELRVPSDPSLGDLEFATDPMLGRTLLSRPRTKLELARELLLTESNSFGLSDSSYIARRDARSIVQVPLVDGYLPEPFVDDGTGKPEIDELGQFLTTTGEPPPTPFFAVGVPDGNRDYYGRLLWEGEPLYGYVDVNHTYMNSLLHDVRPFFVPESEFGNETVFKIVSGARVLLGVRDEAPTTVKQYPPDPERADDYVAMGLPVPAGLDTAPIEVSYRAFDPTTSPLVDLIYAAGTVVAHPEVDDALALFHRISIERPHLVARLVGLGLELKRIADNHPEAWIPGDAMFWDDLLQTLVQMARKPNLLEEVVRGFKDDRTVQIKEVFAAYLKYRDELSYARDVNQKNNYFNFNSTANLTTHQIVSTPGATPNDPLLPTSVPAYSTPVDRSKPDSGDNRSAFQRFIRLLHDANGLGMCTKENAVVPLKIEWPQNSGIVINLKYPTDFLVKTVCTVVSASTPPDPMPLCGVLRFHDMAALIVDVATERAKFDIRDECLRDLLASSLNQLVGGPDAFLQEVSQIDGLKLNPTVGGVARLLSFDTPYSDWGGYAGDDMYPQTRDFLAGLIDPVPSTLCDPVPFTDTDGVVMKLRSCKTFEDTLRSRDGNSLYPLEQLRFVELVQPLALAFADNDGSPLFVELIDKLHLHWGTPEQTLQECDPGLPPTHARWCSQDGVVRYEPLLAEVIEDSDLFAALQDVVTELDEMSVDHCLRFDTSTRECTESEPRSAVSVLVEALRVMLDPERNEGLTDRHGNSYVIYNDGTTGPQTTPLYLLIDSFKAIDKAFADDAAKNGDSGVHDGWRAARSEIVDTFFAVTGTGTQARFANPATAEILPKLLEVAQAQILANCPDRRPNAHCEWADGGLAKNVGDTLGDPLFATGIDVFDAVRDDPDARREIQRLILYLVDEASPNDAEASTLSAAVDVLQILGDDTNLEPLYRIGSKALAPSLVAEDGTVVRRGVADAGIETLTRIFARGYEGEQPMCTSGVDPERTIAQLLQNVVTPMGDGQLTPIEVLLSVIGDVNRVDPESQSKFTGPDYQNVGKEAGDFFLDEASGLEQVWEVVRQATQRK